MLPDPVFLTVAPNGARRMPADHPATPVTPAAMARCAAECLEKGASAIHMHARDNTGKHTLDPEINRTFYTAIRREVGERMIVQVTTEAVSRYSTQQQIALVDALRPEAISMALGELIRSEEDVVKAGKFFKQLRVQHTLCQIILYSPEQVRWYKALKNKQVIPEHGHHVLFVIGRHAQTAQLGLTDFLAEFDHSCRWGVCAFGEKEHAICSAAMREGGDPRVGFENNIMNQDGRQAVNNSELIAQLADDAGAAKITLLQADEVRQRLNESG